jgi:thioredoxin-dependent peroxiredoxin
VAGKTALPVARKGETMLNLGDNAPAFSLLSDAGENVTLKDLLGETLVLYFFPKADTPG